MLEAQAISDNAEQIVYLGRTRVGTVWSALPCPSRSPYFVRMDAPAILAALAAQDAAEALILLGFPVRPYGPDMDLWQIGCLIWTDDELMGLAARHGVGPASDRLQ